MLKTLTTLILLLCVSSFVVTAQTFRYIYHDLPAVINPNFPGAVNSEEPGFRKVDITAANIAKFRTFGSPGIVALVTTLQNPASALSRAVKRVTGFSNGHVTQINVNLINDGGGLTTDNLFCNSSGMAWPCAWNSDTRGTICIGELAAGTPDINETIVHEIFHTQSINIAGQRNHRYADTIDNVRVAYGGDEGHYLEELMADQQQSMDEGIGTFWGSQLLPDPSRATLRQLTTNQPFFLGSQSFLSGVSDAWNAPHTTLIDTQFRQPIPTGTTVSFSTDLYNVTLSRTPIQYSRYIARLYRFCNIPGQYVFHSELLPEIYLHLFQANAFIDTATGNRSMIEFMKYYSRFSENARHRYPVNMAMFLAAQMEAYNNAAPAGTSRVSSIFALGLYDMLMRFSMPDADLKRILDITTFDITNLPQIPKSKAYLNYIRLRPKLKAAVLKDLLGTTDCRLPTSRIELAKAAATLKQICEGNDLVTLTAGQ